MAIDKMELLKRYKELKAQGVEITLMELKRKLESGESIEQENQPQHSVVTPEPVKVEEPALQSSSWTTSFYSQPEHNLEPESQPILEPSPAMTSEPVQTSNYSENFNANYSFGVQEPVEVPFKPQVQPETQLTAPLSGPAKYALIGFPLGHSLSSFIHEAGFKSLGVDSTYEILETPPDSLVERIKFLKYNNYSGFNVTIPLKLPVTLFLNEIDSSADVVGAVNTVVINPDKTMKGYNTDVIGFRNAIPSDVTVAGKVAGVLGTGGAARAAITALAQSQVRKIKVYTRNIPNCAELMKFLREKFPLVEFEVYQIERIRDLSDINILVNTTPIGMQGKAADFTPIEENELRTLPQGAIVYDVIYNPKKTILLKLAQKNGYKIINGVDMFIHQALAAEQIWTGKTPDFKDMKIAALENL